MKENFFNGISYKLGDDLYKIFFMVFKQKVRSKLIHDRLELFDKKYYQPTPGKAYFGLVDLITSFLPKRANIKNRYYTNVYILDLIYSYRG